MSDYIKSKVLIEKVNQLRIKMKLSNTSESFIRAYAHYIINNQKLTYIH